MNTKPLVYFKTYARENGCPESILNSGSDLAIWNWIRDYQRITIWQRQEEKSKEWKHNHISKGYDANVSFPVPSCAFQEKAWGGAAWRGIEGKISCYHVVTEI